MSRYQLNRLKAQTSMEFLAIFALLVLALVSMSYISFQKSISILKTQEDLKADNLVGNVANKINLVFIEGHGFSMNMILPERLNGYEYTFDMEENQLRLYIFNNTYIKFLVTENVTGIPHTGVNTLRNKNKVVVIT